MKILLLSRYDNLGATSRYRFYQYLAYLRKEGFNITINPLLDNTYIQNLYSGQQPDIFKIARAYAQRIFLLLKSNYYDLIWLEKEAFPWLPQKLESILFRSKIPYIVDYDDAWFHRYDLHSSQLVRRFLSKKIDAVMRRAALVIVGNDYLAERARIAGARWVEILPTVIDLERYPISSPPENEIFTIGWIGSPLTSRYLKEIQPALQEICKDGTVRVVAIGAGALELEGVPLEIQPWSEATEVKQIQQFDIGIMPLPDTPWERGKCGLKLIQYMACARPVVCSPVGINKKLVKQGINGFQASNMKEWVNSFQILKNNPSLRWSMGKMGRVIVEEKYCLQVTCAKISQWFHKVKEMR